MPSPAYRETPSDPPIRSPNSAHNILHLALAFILILLQCQALGGTFLNKKLNKLNKFLQKYNKGLHCQAGAWLFLPTSGRSSTSGTWELMMPSDKAQCNAVGSKKADRGCVTHVLGLQQFDQERKESLKTAFPLITAIAACSTQQKGKQPVFPALTPPPPHFLPAINKKYN